MGLGLRTQEAYLDLAEVRVPVGWLGGSSNDG